MNRYVRWLIRLIGPALLVFFLWRSDLRALVATLAGVDPWPVLLSLALMPLFIVVKAWRWGLIVQEQGHVQLPLGFLSALYTIGLYAGGITPGQSGDFIKAWYLRERGVPLASGLLSIVLDRLFDFVVMALLALLGVAVFADALPAEARDPLRIAVVAFAVVVVLMTAALMARTPREWLLGFLRALVPVARLRDVIDRLREQLAPLSLRAGPLALLLLATSLSASMTMLRIWLLYQALHLDAIPLVEIVGSTALIAIAQTLPISFSGVGVRDGMLIAALARYGYAPELALSLSALFLLVNVQHILIGFVMSLRYPLARREAAG